MFNSVCKLGLGTLRFNFIYELGLGAHRYHVPCSAFCLCLARWLVGWGAYHHLTNKLVSKDLDKNLKLTTKPDKKFRLSGPFGD